MDDKKLTKLAIISSLIGLILLYYATTVIEAKSYPISGINKEMIDQDVKVQGAVVNIMKAPTVIIITLRDSGSSIKVVSFEPEIINVEKGMEIEVTGKVAVYKNELEIIADSIKDLND